MNEFTELEYKYNATSVSLNDFITLMRKLNPIKREDVSSWDIYYTSNSDKNYEEFIRYRDSQKPELTIKRKTNNYNNWERIEVDLPLDNKKINESIVNSFVKLINYKENFRIYKSCFIFWFNDVNIVYYIVYDNNMKERGRFIEIEVNKNIIEHLNNPLDTLKNYELYLTEIGIKSSNRLKKSLFEMFVNYNN